MRFGSFAAPRVKWADSKDFWDTEDVERRMLNSDWKRCIDCGLGKYIDRMDDEEGGDPQDEVEETLEVLWECAHHAPNRASSCQP